MSGKSEVDEQWQWASGLFDALSRAGVRDVIVSPGSRSTPFVLAAAAQPDLLCHDIIDERSAGFFALGLAKVKGEPPLLLCTSGTAPAHYLPAIIEASLTHTPLLVLTADRPLELHHVGANQTVDQVHLYGHHVRHFADLGVADARDATLRGVRRTAVQAVAIAKGPTPGPVHLLARARKPLEPASRQRPPEAPVTRVFPPALTVSEAALAELEEAVAGARRGLLVLGPAPVSQAKDRAAVCALSRVTGFPLLAESTSQLRFARDREGEAVVDAFDLIYRDPSLREALRPDLVLQLGAAPISAGLDRLFDELPGQRIVIAAQGFPDPWNRARAIVRADVGGAARALAERLASRSPIRTPFVDRLRALDRELGVAASRLLEEAAPTLTEGAVMRGVLSALPAGALLSVGNSLVVRQLDTFCPGMARDVGVLSQRGASGIDGLIAGALGASIALEGPTVLILGDVSFVHDVGACSLLRRAEAPLVVVVVDNGGGRIFEQLPLGDLSLSEREMAHFTTPHDTSACAVAISFGLRASAHATVASFEEAFADAIARPGCTVLEADVPHDGGRGMTARLVREVRGGAS